MSPRRLLLAALTGPCVIAEHAVWAGLWIAAAVAVALAADFEWFRQSIGVPLTGGLAIAVACVAAVAALRTAFVLLAAAALPAGRDDVARARLPVGIAFAGLVAACRAGAELVHSARLEFRGDLGVVKGATPVWMALFALLVIAVTIGVVVMIRRLRSADWRSAPAITGYAALVLTLLASPSLPITVALIAAPIAAGGFRRARRASIHVAARSRAFRSVAVRIGILAALPVGAAAGAGTAAGAEAGEVLGILLAGLPLVAVPGLFGFILALTDAADRPVGLRDMIRHAAADRLLWILAVLSAGAFAVCGYVDNWSLIAGVGLGVAVGLMSVAIAAIRARPRTAGFAAGRAPDPGAAAPVDDRPIAARQAGGRLPHELPDLRRRRPRLGAALRWLPGPAVTILAVAFILLSRPAIPPAPPLADLNREWWTGSPPPLPPARGAAVAATIRRALRATPPILRRYIIRQTGEPLDPDRDSHILTGIELLVDRRPGLKPILADPRVQAPLMSIGPIVNLRHDLIEAADDDPAAMLRLLASPYFRPEFGWSVLAVDESRIAPPLWTPAQLSALDAALARLVRANVRLDLYALGSAPSPVAPELAVDVEVSFRLNGWAARDGVRPARLVEAPAVEVRFHPRNGRWGQRWLRTLPLDADWRHLAGLMRDRTGLGALPPVVYHRFVAPSAEEAQALTFATACEMLRARVRAVATIALGRQEPPTSWAGLVGFDPPGDVGWAPFPSHDAFAGPAGGGRVDAGWVSGGGDDRWWAVSNAHLGRRVWPELTFRRDSRHGGWVLVP
jgi:hypothetical protein